ncbi:Uncharacterised protein [Moraxella caprae]|uniref:Uncharacterized protein n=1 Tax=Moraxella caprae TaxID=90240 RepID=A0A378R4S9_9GAMM|nr:Uncharacterised protein [Moraxella caprae]
MVLKNDIIIKNNIICCHDNIEKNQKIMLK